MANVFAKTEIFRGCLAPGQKIALVKIRWSNTVSAATQTLTPSDYGITTVKSITFGTSTEAKDSGFVAQAAAPTSGVYPVALYYTDSNAVADSKLIIVPDGTAVGDTVYSVAIIKGV